MLFQGCTQGPAQTCSGYHLITVQAAAKAGIVLPPCVFPISCAFVAPVSGPGALLLCMCVSKACLEYIAGPAQHLGSLQSKQRRLF